MGGPHDGVPPCPGMGYLLPGQDRGYPMMGYPSSPSRDWVCPSRSGWGYPPPFRDGVPLPQPGMGYPPPRDRTPDRVPDTRRAVCLLRSRRSTFLFKNCSQKPRPCLEQQGTFAELIPARILIEIRKPSPLP